MGRPPQPLSAERRARIFDAAAHAFLTHGYEAASLNRIIEAAGMRKSSFYHYFASKQDLRDRMIEELTVIAREWIRLPDLRELDAQSYWGAMSALVDGLGAMAEQHPETIAISRMLYSTSTMADPAAAVLGDAARSWCATALARGIDLGVVRDDLPLALLTDITMAVLVAIDRWAVNSDRESVAPTAELALGALRGLLAGTT